MNKYEELSNYCKSKEVSLVAVSKTRPESAIKEMYEKGQRIFGENRPQEMVEKHQNLPKDIEWHMIGHLQSNKVKQIMPFVTMIHSGNRKSVIKEIQKQAAAENRSIDVLLQIRIAEEESKQGWDFDGLSTFLSDRDIHEYKNINWRGVMGMATFTDDSKKVSSEFSNLKKHFDVIKKEYFSNHDDFDTISMGMSGDYKIAIEAGSTMIRVGSLLFANSVTS